MIAVAAVSVFALVWSGNFLLLLPSLNPAFLEQMPRAATFASKLLFGLTMAWMLVQIECLTVKRASTGFAPGFGVTLTRIV